MSLLFETELTEIGRFLQGVFSGIACQAERLRIHIGGFDHSLETEIVERIETDKAGDVLNLPLLRGDKLSL
jgi:hypothetical protein